MHSQSLGMETILFRAIILGDNDSILKLLHAATRQIPVNVS